MRSNTRTLAALAAVLVAVVAPSQGSARPQSSAVPESQLQGALLAQINAFRAAHGLARLRVSGALDAVADGHSAQMARLGYFSHNSANGQSFSARIAQAYSPRGYRSWSVGENLLWSSPEITPSGALRMWMNSPEHRANLLDRSWREIGLSAVHVTNAPGVYNGDEVTIVTADFGVRS